MRKLVKPPEYIYECDRSWCHQPVVGKAYSIRMSLPSYFSLYAGAYTPLRDIAEKQYCSEYCAMTERNRLFPIMSGEPR